MATKMTATEITERINKAQETVRKLNDLIWKREAKLKKLHKELAKASDKVESGHRWSPKEMVQWSIEDEEDALEQNRKKLPEKQAILEKWQKKLEEVNAEAKKLDEIPEQLKKLQQELAENIATSDIRHRERMYKDEAEMEWHDFTEKYSYTEREYYMGRSQKDFEEMVKRDAVAEAKWWILDLINRVEKKVGEITEWHLWFTSKALNGYVTGTKGFAKVETIIAGGYNIQRRHNRVLVK